MIQIYDNKIVYQNYYYLIFPFFVNELFTCCLTNSCNDHDLLEFKKEGYEVECASNDTKNNVITGKLVFPGLEHFLKIACVGNLLS